MNPKHTFVLEAEIGERENSWSPYHALLGTMLRNAVEEACLSPKTGPMKDRLVSRTARRWFSSDEVGSPETGITFAWVCEHLGICPDAVRYELSRLTSKPEGQALRRRRLGNFT
jgi:hypothetical protein